MKTNYILIDFENTQPKSLPSLKNNHFKVFVFLGDRQNKVAFELADALQNLGSDARYIKIEGNGKNALDFHIAYYIGRIAAEETDVFFHIISKDAGFDPLIKHLKAQNICADRVDAIEDIPLLRNPVPQNLSDRVSATIRSLKNKGTSRPRKIKTLRNTVSSQFKKALPGPDLDAIINVLEKQGVITLKGESVAYSFPE